MRQLDNNPRAFAETVSIFAWRTPYDGQTGIADLHIDVVFSEGRLGGEKDSPVRFRLSLKRAEVHVIGDIGRVITFPPKDVAKAPVRAVTLKSSQSAETSARASGELTASPKSLDLSASAAASTSRGSKAEITAEEQLGHLKFQHIKTTDGYAWVITPTIETTLNGQPWDSADRRMTLKDSGHARSKGDPPEPKIELRCRREDLQITDIELSGRSNKFWNDLSKAKKLAVEQYIKDELMKIGFECGELDNPFAQIVLADVIPELGD